jgi:hypothetical protein
MARNHEEKVYPGGILNRINRITVRATGESVAHCNGPHTGQEQSGTPIEPRSVISRTTNEPPVSRKKNDATKNDDV